MRAAAALCAIAILALPAVAADGAEEPAQALEVRLASAKPEYAYGETVGLTVTLQNRSDRRLSVALSGPPDGIPAAVHRVSDGAPPLPVVAAVPTWGDALLLDPGQEAAFEFSGLVLAFGEHVLQASCHVTRAAGPADASPAANAWTGLAVSNEVRVRIAGPVAGGQPALTPSGVRRLAESMRDSEPWLKISVARHLAWYLPSSAPYFNVMLADADAQVRASTAYALGGALDRDGGLDPRARAELVSRVMEIGAEEDDVKARAAVVSVLESASGKLTGAQRKTAGDLLGRYVLQTQSDSLAGRAAVAYLTLDQEGAAAAIRKRLRWQDPGKGFLYGVGQGLRVTPQADGILEALDRP
ncbi:MAG: hypothetical protein JW990_12675 [Thermoleophilia bacterium]|nr:hypothetical protein [Thermoleophilia bacterium]